MLQKIDERLQAAAKKNAALDLNYYQTLGGRLEYADLREVQDAILSKTNWPLFQARFANKETLAKRFDQLAELRNGIRHSRTVDEVTRKEGEAALLWFRQVLWKMIADLRPYAEYQDSGSRWLANVPLHWEVRNRRKYLIPNVREGPRRTVAFGLASKGVFARVTTDPYDHHGDGSPAAQACGEGGPCH